MKIAEIILHRFESPRAGFYLQINDCDGNETWGECCPLPRFSKETLDECLEQFHQKQERIFATVWTEQNLFLELKELKLFPSLSFGLESALLNLLSPVHEHTVKVSTLLMGTPKEILELAELHFQEGYTSAKLKVGSLSFDDAALVIHRLKDKFRLRIDVNRAWKTMESLRFFGQFALDAFDYVEEPFQNPKDLAKFPHPLAVDESFPSDITLSQLEALPSLRALIYKPTIQGGMAHCLHLNEWALKQGIDIVLSSSFESALGLSHISLMAHRLTLSAPVGIGTLNYSM